MNKHKYQNLIKCGDHSYAPWCIVCRCIYYGTAKEYVRIPMGEGQQDDYLCPKCFDKGPEGHTLDDIRAVCIYCARKLVSHLQKREP
jgi:hypothetical protein